MPNARTLVKTNATANSIKDVQLRVLTFAELWNSYVTGSPYADPTGHFKNQCAIRMSATFHAVGIEMKSFSGKLVKPMPGKKELGRILLKGKPAATRAYELAAWLQLQPIAGLQLPENITGAHWRSNVDGRTGIIFFYGYWQQEGDPPDNFSGGHIDLWNGSRFPNNGTIGTLENIARFTLGMRTGPGYSDLGKSRQILFWAMK